MRTFSSEQAKKALDKAFDVQELMISEQKSKHKLYGASLVFRAFIVREGTKIFEFPTITVDNSVGMVIDRLTQDEPSAQTAPA